MEKKMPDQNQGKILKPRIHDSVFIAEGARIYGDVEIGEGSSIWFNAVIRGDEGKITIGRHTNIQDNSVIHSDGMIPVEIGDSVTVGHGAIIRGCRLGNSVMVGMNATIMSGVEIGDYCSVGANCFIPYSKKFPPRSLIAGVPAKLLRELKEEETRVNDMPVAIYKEVIQNYLNKKIIGHTR
jgi:carbonic anhydrase/acetyltransferase-like protein (isoleucine patch superfamily)